MLFVCTHNSARSIIAEALLRHHGGAGFEAFSAGTQPGQVRPQTLRVLDEAGIDAAGARSKSVAELLGQPFDYVITVCDQAREACPVFPGARRTLHWSFADPSAATGSEEERVAAYRQVMGEIDRAVRGFVAQGGATD